jgi:hypothetical protein
VPSVHGLSLPQYFHEVLEGRGLFRLGEIHDCATGFDYPATPTSYSGESCGPFMRLSSRSIDSTNFRMRVLKTGLKRSNEGFEVLC